MGIFLNFQDISIKTTPKIIIYCNFINKSPKKFQKSAQKFWRRLRAAETLFSNFWQLPPDRWNPLEGWPPPKKISLLRTPKLGEYWRPLIWDANHKTNNILIQFLNKNNWVSFFTFVIFLLLHFVRFSSQKSQCFQNSQLNRGYRNSAFHFLVLDAVMITSHLGMKFEHHTVVTFFHSLNDIEMLACSTEILWMRVILSANFIRLMLLG